MLLTTIVLVAFYPALSAEVSLVDDKGTIDWMLSSADFNLKSILLPHSLSGGYYRPLIGISYLLGKHLWFLDERFLHLENVLGHLLNCVLVFLICRQSLRFLRVQLEGLLPLGAALIFAVHPIVTESVNWISGRTDIMMSNFILLSFYLLLVYKNSPRKRTVVAAASFLCAFVAIFAKEAALGYFIALPFIVNVKPDNQGALKRFSLIKHLLFFSILVFVVLYLSSFKLVVILLLVYYMMVINTGSNDQLKSDFFRVLRDVVVIVSVMVVIVGFFWGIRQYVFISSVSKIGHTIKLIGQDIDYTLSLFTGAIGFYVKKFIFPLPLNFFIIEIDPLYDIAGIGAVMAALYLLSKRTLPSVLGLTGFFVILPTLPFAFGTIAWTGYAERYVYLASAFWIIALSLWLYKSAENLGAAQARLAYSVTLLVILASSGVTYARNITWKRNVTLLQDTVEKSSKVKMLRDVYVQALLDAGMVDEAMNQYRTGRTLVARNRLEANDVRADLLVAGQLRKEGKRKEALELYEEALKRTQYGSEPLVETTLQLVSEMEALDSSDGQGSERLAGLEDDLRRRLMGMTTNPKTLIELAKGAIRKGDVEGANALLGKTLKTLRPDDRLYHVAERLRSEVNAR